MLVVEVSNGFCKKPFECDFLPRSTFASIFIDVTDSKVTPDEYWQYNHANKTFTPPPMTNGSVDYTSVEYIMAKWNDVRNHRNVLLMESDWTQIPDAPLGFFEKLKWKKYRRALRDVPQTIDNPVFFQFPPKPSSTIRPSVIQSVSILFKSLFRSS